MWRNSKLLLSAVRGALRSCQLAVWFTCLAGVSPDSRQKLDLHFINFPICIRNGMRNPVKLVGVAFIHFNDDDDDATPLTVIAADGSRGAPRRLIKIIWME